MPDTRGTLIVVDDDRELRQLLTSFLERNGFDVVALPDGSRIDACLERQGADLLILDLMLPSDDGLTICKRLRQRGETLPIIMLTARDEIVHRIVGLELGADDYLGKPFDPQELLARIRALLRRAQGAVANGGAPGVVRFGDFECHLETYELLHRGETVRLTRGEFELLAALVRHANRPVRRERLLNLTGAGNPDRFDRAIDVQISRLRRVVEEDPANPRYIRTIWGIGYMFVVEPSA